MCGRFILDAGAAELAAHFGLDQPPSLAPRYNIAPSQLVAVVAPKADPAKRGLALLKWGLVPDWSNDGKPGPINARAETVGGLPTFSEPFRQKRCVIPARGFSEWRATGGKKIPQRFRLASGGVMGFAGLWDSWLSKDNKRLFTCCIITTDANELVRPFHDRMPAILSPDEYAAWLDHSTPLKYAHAMLRPTPAEFMEVSEASTLVNSPKNEGARLLDPLAA
jgi:putative SOS response-associated peptidase YedK